MKPATFPFWILFAVGFPIYFVGLWVGVTFIISRLGWQRLREFEVRPEYINGVQKIRSFTMSGARIGPSNYNNCLTVIVTHGGLYLRPFVLFQTFHPPLLIPWSTFSPPRPKKFLLGTYFEYTVTTPQGKSVNLCFFSRPVFETVEAARAEGGSDSPFSNSVMLS